MKVDRNFSVYNNYIHIPFNIHKYYCTGNCILGVAQNCGKMRGVAWIDARYLYKKILSLLVYYTLWFISKGLDMIKHWTANWVLMGLVYILFSKGCKEVNYYFYFLYESYWSLPFIFSIIHSFHYYNDFIRYCLL